MGVGAFSVQIMKGKEHRNYGWTDLELGSLNCWENYTIRKIDSDTSEIIYEWSLLNFVISIVTHDV